MDERQRRIGQNEALFREVNERVVDLGDKLRTAPGLMTMVCECGDQNCLEHVEVDPGEYEQLRSDSALFAIKPGHDRPEVEEVVVRNDRFWTVRKLAGAARDLAERTDPRS
jgi:hypothetical protein